MTHKQKAIIKEVNRQHLGLHFDPAMIASLQNKGSVSTLTGAAQWDEAEVKMIIDYLTKDYLGVKLHLKGKWE